VGARGSSLTAPRARRSALSRFRRDEAAVAHDVGYLLHVPAALAVLSIPVAALDGDRRALAVLAGTALVVGGLGQFLVRRFRHAHAPDLWPAVEVVGVGWLTAVLVSSGVLALLGHSAADGAADAVFRDPWNALFEGTSGITSTGLTMADGIEAQLSRTVQWWRSSTQWVGGVGVVLFAAASSGTADAREALYEAEGRGDELAGDVPATIRRTWAIYLGLTAVALVAFQLIERDPWIALNHGLTAISTGGFTVTDDSLGGLTAGGQLVAMAVMVTGAMTFVSHQLLFVRRDLDRVRRSTPLRAQAVVLVGGVVVVVGLARLTGTEVSALEAAFQWVSASATAGFTAVPTAAAWTTPLLVVMILGMVVGAPSGSTGGGVKLDRIVWLAKQATARVRGRRRYGSPPVRWDGRVASPRQVRTSVRHAGGMLLLWLATLLVGCLVLIAVTDAEIVRVVFEAASAMSNVGLDAEVVGPDLDGRAKATFSALMYLGRLELFTALYLAVQHDSAR
jgi:trk system potassium uptake protein